jgi:hypothetical protein
LPSSGQTEAAEASEYERRIGSPIADMATIDGSDDPLLSIEEIGNRRNRLSERTRDTRRFLPGEYGGMTFGLVMHLLCETDSVLDDLGTGLLFDARQHSPGPSLGGSGINVTAPSSGDATNQIIALRGVFDPGLSTDPAMA